jgi:hypothetical protein
MLTEHFLAQGDYLVTNFFRLISNKCSPMRERKMVSSSLLGESGHSQHDTVCTAIS